MNSVSRAKIYHLKEAQKALRLSLDEIDKAFSDSDNVADHINAIRNTIHNIDLDIKDLAYVPLKDTV